MGKVTLFYNCTILRDHQLIKDDLWIQDGIIIDPQSANYTCDDCIDSQGCLISPGFIDLELNGGFGVDFSKLDDPESEVDKVARCLPKTGVTSFCPSIVSSSIDYYKNVLPRVNLRNGSVKNGAGILGWHLNGPFISMEKVGAQNRELIQSFTNGLNSIEEVYGSLDNVRLITLAPELKHADNVIRQLIRWNIKVSLGHSSCTFSQAENALHCGASMITHLFNAMPTFHHRDPSLVGLLALDRPDESPVYFGIIADGNHTHPAALRMAYRISPKTLFLVTGGVAPLGLGKGHYTLGSTDVVVYGDDDSPKCTVTGTDILSGSICPMIICIKNLKKHTNCSTVYALEAATLTPALAIGISDRKGTLNFNTDADLVLLNPESVFKFTYEV